MPERAPNGGSTQAIPAALTLAAGLCTFALCAHQRLPWVLASVGGLLLAAGILGRSLYCAEHPAAVLGLAAFSSRTAFYATAGCAVGIGLGCLHRWRLGVPVVPAGGWEAFAAIACLIGATEELIYRGWMQGQLRVLGRPAAVVAAAVAHAAYKTLLFAWPLDATRIDLGIIAFWTAAGGIVFGVIREESRSVIPPLLAHALFDLVTYGAVAQAPWWVWR